jgi:hypothetical protein
MSRSLCSAHYGVAHHLFTQEKRFDRDGGV